MRPLGGASDLHGDLHGDLYGGTGQVAENVLRVVEELDGEVTRQELRFGGGGT